MNRKFMTQEDKELFLKDICARLPFGVKAKITEEGVLSYDSGIGVIVGKEHIDNEIFILQCKNDGWCLTAISEFVPYLRPMSSMTEEEAKEIAILHDIKEKDILSIKVKSDYIDVIVDDGFCSTERITIWYDEIVSSIKCFDWLNKNMFDYHGLISMGLALEAPEGMYKTK